MAHRNIIVQLLLILCFEGILARDGAHTQPEQVHLSFGNNESDVVVTWTTLDLITAEATVEYGTSERNLNATGYSNVFVDGGKKHRTIYIHRVILTDLQPDTQYVYRCGSEQGWSDQFWFKTIPSGTNWAPRLNIYGDLGYDNDVSVPRIQRDAQNHNIDAVIHVGDFAYDMHSKNGKVGDEFMRLIEPIAAHVPYMVSPGNHEKSYNFSHYKERFTMPGNSENLFFSFNMGPVHFISISTEVYWSYFEYGMDVVANQYNWILSDLEEANKNRATRPWIVLFGHRPMYCSSISKECNHDAPTRVGLNKMYGLEPLLRKYGVDIVFWGHQHNYERLWPVYDNEIRNGSFSAPYVNPKAPVHIITGSAGCKEDITPFVAPHPTSALRSTNYGVTEVQFLNATHMKLSQIATDDNDRVVDQILLFKDYHGPYKLQRG